MRAPVVRPDLSSVLDPTTTSPRRLTPRRAAPVALASVLAAVAGAPAVANADFTYGGSPLIANFRPPAGGAPSTWACSADMSVSPEGDVVAATSGADGAYAITHSANGHGGGGTLYQGDAPDGPCSPVAAAAGTDGTYSAAAFTGPASGTLPLRTLHGGFPSDTSSGDADPVDLPAAADPARPGDVRTVVTRAGAAVVVARDANGHVVARKDAAGGQGDGLVDVGGDIGTGGHLLALREDDYGAVTAVWSVGGRATDGSGALPFRVASATLGAAGYWSAPVVSAPIREGASDGVAAASVDRYGSVLAAYGVPGEPSSGAATTVEAGVVERAGDVDHWEGPQRIEPTRTAGREVVPAATVANTDGRPVAVFDVREPGDGGRRTATVEAATTDAAGRWQALVPVSAARDAAENPGATASATFNAAQGVVTIAWTSSTGTVGQNVVKTRDFYPWDATFSRVYPVPEDAAGPSAVTHVLLGTDDHGDTLLGLPLPGATGGDFMGYAIKMRFVADDVGGPLLQPIEGPDEVAVGQTATFRTDDERDLYSAIADSSWDFGDGTTITQEFDLDAEHRWSTPGTKTVSLTGRDALGNTSTITKLVRVTAAGARKAAGTRAVAPREVAAKRPAGRVAVSSATRRGSWLGLRVSRRASLSLAVQRRVVRTERRAGRTHRVVSWVPARTIAVDTGGAGVVRTKVVGPEARATYRVVVRGRDGSGTTLKARTLRVRAAR